MKSLQLDVEPFDLAQTLDGGQAFRWHPCEDGTFRGVVGSRVLSVSGDGKSVSVSWVDGGSKDDVRSEVDDYFLADTDVDDLRSVLSSEPGFGEYVATMPLIRVMR